MSKNAIALLKADHATVRKLLKQLTDTTERAQKTRSALLERIGTELRLHTAIEEEIFYPAFRKAGTSKAARMFFEATEEHRAIEELVLPDLEQTKPGSEKFSGRAKVLKELVEHHADEEEEELFPAAKKLLSSEVLMELGARMEARKEELKQAGVSVS
jgi:hemerythrin-like domain-containing protein